MPQADSIVSLSNVGRTFRNGSVALRDVSFDMRRGSFVSILGPSGCGKSTLLRLIARLMRPTSGAIDLSGTDAPEAGSKLSFVFQDATLMPWASVKKNIELPLEITTTQKPPADKVTSALRLVGLDEFAGAYPRELSGGMKMRASIARALVTDPDLLLMDEPFAALDELTRERLNDDLLNLWRSQHFSVLFVTHSVYESVYLSQRIIVLSERPGEVIADIPIDAPYPRGKDFRLSSEYSSFCRAVHDALRHNETGDARQ